MMNDSDLSKHIIEKAKAIISSWTDDDIYAVSFYVENLNENPYMPSVSFGYNTENQYKKSISSASDEGEARWNFAFWIQNQDFIFGVDGETKDMVKQWMLGHSFPYCEDFTLNYADESAVNSYYELLNKICGKFVSVLVEAVKELHRSGFINEKFGREIPVVIHELEYYDKIAIQNIAANTLPLVEGLVEFCGYCPQ